MLKYAKQLIKSKLILVNNSSKNKTIVLITK